MGCRNYKVKGRREGGGRDEGGRKEGGGEEGGRVEVRRKGRREELTFLRGVEATEPASRKHFESLVKHYGRVFIVNLLNCMLLSPPFSLPYPPSLLPLLSFLSSFSLPSLLLIPITLHPSLSG
jgi:hypothetical protein